MRSKGLQIVLRALGTVVLAAGFVVLVGRAPFVRDAAYESDATLRATERPESTPVGMQIATGALQSPSLPELTEGASASTDLPPSLGLFKAGFAATDENPGFVTEERKVDGSCSGAGQRFAEAECPTCRQTGDAVAGEVLFWQETVEGKDVARVVSRDCVSIGDDGVPIVATLRFGEGPADLTEASVDLANGIVPLLPGATRVASINLGDMFATYDEVPRPSTALPDMALALREWGWREVSDSGASNLEAFQGQRVFTNNANATCVISLTKQDDTYQLLTIINSRA